MNGSNRIFLVAAMSITSAALGCGGGGTTHPDSGVRDTGMVDGNVTDTGLPDTGLPDTGLPDTGTPDTGTPDTGTPDTGAFDAGCSAGQIPCSGTCIDPLTSASHCGTCGHTCASTETCSGGVCMPMTCPGTQMRCGATCADTQTDNANCGACGAPCAAGNQCTGGVCHPACPAPNMLCTAGMTTTCTDTTSDASHCGSCANVCTGGRTCQSSSCACPSGRALCGGSCVDTATDTANCGACGAPCPTGVACTASVCTCPSGLSLCGTGLAGVCTNRTIDPANCGTCGHACGAGQSCVSSACVTTSCGAGLALCAGSCVNATNDDHNCGGCGNVCGAGTTCQTSACRPANDLFAHATTLTLGPAETTITGSTANATHDGPTSSCSCTSNGNVWYRFVLASRAVVYFDTAGSNMDTSLFLTNGAGAVITNACNDDAGCPTMGGGFLAPAESRVATVLAPGTYYLAVGGCDTGSFTLHAQQILTSIGSFFYDAPVYGSGYTTTGLIGTSAATSACGGTASGEDVRWFVTCGGQPQFFSLCQSDARGGASASWSRRVGTTSYDPSMYLSSGLTGLQVTCNDDGTAAGGSNCQGTGGDAAQFGSRLNNVTVPRGINAVFVDERTGGPGMQYTLVYQVQ